ncbi:MAG: membrane fusion protein (multidrug efflux system) [Marivirga sp.]|jgi:membrane fusion protein (multidrug efflux system)
MHVTTCIRRLAKIIFMNKIYIRIVALLAVAATIVYLLFPNLFSSNAAEKQETAKTASSAIKGIVIDAQIVNTRKFSNDIVLAGSLLANESVDLASEIAGKITKIYFEEGQFVKKGQLLLTTNVDDLKADLRRLKFTAELSKETEQRQKQLLESEAISKEEYDIAYTNNKTNEAAIASLEAQVKRSQIAAPFAGFIGLRYVSEGSYITPATEIASLYNVNPIKLEFSVPSRYSTLIKAGNAITFSSEAENINRKATVYAVEPQIDPITRTLKVRAKCDNPDNMLIPGQFVRVQLSIESNDDAILIPTTGIMPNADGHLVFVIKQGEARAQVVKLGVRTAREVEIVQGLNKGDTIAVAGVAQLKDRALVSIKNLAGGEH